MPRSDSLFEGRITQRDVERFTDGDCHYLARALNKAEPSFKLAAFTHRGLADLHAFVLMPDGNVLDVYGVQSPKAAQERWDTTQPIAERPWSDLKEFGLPQFGEYTYRRARTVAQYLLTSVR